MGLGREDGGERDGSRVGGDGAGEGRWSESAGAWAGLGLGKMEGSETGGAWVGEAGEGRGWGGKIEGSETGGAWMGLGREDGGEQDGRRVGRDGVGERRWRGARREAHGWGRGLGRED